MAKREKLVSIFSIYTVRVFVRFYFYLNVKQ